MMKVIQINNTDLPGARFNGYNLLSYFNETGIDTKQLVYEKLSDNERVISFSDSIDTLEIYKKYESEHSIKSLVFPYAHKIMNMKEFREADIVHYHLIHNYIVSLYDLPLMFKKKKSVWTIHDPWVITGHCIYPMECDKYMSGCTDCPDLSRNFPMIKDNAYMMWMLKKEIFSKLDVDIVVASEWMKNLVQTSPLTNSLKRIHVIPFGINLQLYNVAYNRKLKIRKKLAIDESDIVLFFRADRSPFKGLNIIKKMLENLDVNKKVTIVTVGEAGLLNKYRIKYKVIDFGWINNEHELSDIYASADIFLMPSTAEAFGVMAIEAMASSLPVVVMEGTALPSIVDAPRCGISFKKDDINDFTEKIERLIENDLERIHRGNLSRQLAERKYDEKIYFDKMLHLYKSILGNDR